MSRPPHLIHPTQRRSVFGPIGLVVGVVLWLTAQGTSAAVDATAVTAKDDFAKSATWQPADATAVRAQAFAWLDSARPTAEIRAKAAAAWPSGDSPAGVELLRRVVNLIAVADVQAQQLVTLCDDTRKSLTAPNFDRLFDEEQPAFYRNNLRLWYGRWLSQQRLYDEAQHQLMGLDPADVVDPASLLFYQSVGYHYLLEKDAGLKSLARLMEREKELPRRYQTMAKLMQGDLEALKDDSLDHISRRMDDIKRRLDLGRTGKKVRGQEDGVIASLDKLIKDMEDQEKKQQQQQQQQQVPSGGAKNIRAAEKSLPMGGKGPGEVAKKNIGNQSGWGDLPPKDREEAMQQIGKEFPSHYRDVIEQYFRKLAAEEAEDK